MLSGLLSYCVDAMIDVGLPNAFNLSGYTNASWTLKVGFLHGGFFVLLACTGKHELKAEFLAYSFVV